MHSEKVIKITLTSLEQLKSLVIKSKFNQTEEMKFFKEAKPQLLSKLVYHSKIYKIKMKKPRGREKVVHGFHIISLIA